MHLASCSPTPSPLDARIHEAFASIHAETLFRHEVVSTEERRLHWKARGNGRYLTAATRISDAVDALRAFGLGAAQDPGGWSILVRDLTADERWTAERLAQRLDGGARRLIQRRGYERHAAQVFADGERIVLQAVLPETLELVGRWIVALVATIGEGRTATIGEPRGPAGAVHAEVRIVAPAPASRERWIELDPEAIAAAQAADWAEVA